MPKKMTHCLTLLILVMLFASGERYRAVAQQTAPKLERVKHLNGDHAESVPRQSVTCENQFDAQTQSLRSTTGYTVRLQMHSEDNYSKENHLCRSQYTFSGLRPDGKAFERGLFAIYDDAWHRSIIFGLDGFLANDNEAVAVISEGAPYSSLDMYVYNFQTDRVTSMYLAPAFLSHLGSACAATLHVSGATSKGLLALATRVSDRCAQAQSWQIKPGATVEGVERPARLTLLPVGAKIVAIDHGSTP